MELKLHRARCFKFWDIASVVCEEAKKNGEDDVVGKSWSRNTVCD